MPAPINTLLIDGSFEELAEELAIYLDEIRKKAGNESANVKGDISQRLESIRKRAADEDTKTVDDAKEQEDRQEVLKKLVIAASALNNAPEKEFIAAYNLLIHLILQVKNTEMFWPRLCQYLEQPITSSQFNGPSLALTMLTTIFNVFSPRRDSDEEDSRYHVFFSILKVIGASSSFEVLRPQLKSLDIWLEEWETDEEDQRKLFLEIAKVADESGEKEQAYLYLLRALRTFATSEVSSPEAKDLSIRALKVALLDPAHYDFQDLTALDSVQALRRSEAIWAELLEIFSSSQLEEYKDFLEEHDGFVASAGLDGEVLHRKIKRLTLASLAAQTPSRSLPYKDIARALQIPEEEVEMWVIDVIRAGLVEGKLSQLNQTFLIHRSTYRVFGEKQWTEVAGRLETWRGSLEGVLAVIRNEREKMIKQKEAELRDIEGKINGVNGSSDRPDRRQQRKPIDNGGD